jgi:hypothetical protein
MVSKNISKHCFSFLRVIKALRCRDFEGSLSLMRGNKAKALHLPAELSAAEN